MGTDGGGVGIRTLFLRCGGGDDSVEGAQIGVTSVKMDDIVHIVSGYGRDGRGRRGTGARLKDNKRIIVPPTGARQTRRLSPGGIIGEYPEHIQWRIIRRICGD